MPARNAALISLLVPSISNKANAVLDMAEDVGLDLLVYSTLRTMDDQARLYRQGRSLSEIKHKADQLTRLYRRPDLATILMDVGPQEGDEIRTKAGPGESMHNYGLAFDAVPIINGKPVWGSDAASMVHWRLYGQLVERAGLEWAGNWKTFREMPHAQQRGASWRTLIMGAK